MIDERTYLKVSGAVYRITQEVKLQMMQALQDKVYLRQ